MGDNAEMNKETRAERIAKARKQPKSPEEEKKLAERYGSMPLEERAFNILLDLGMVELTPDPDDPSYDDTLDIDNENIIVSDKAVDKQKPTVEKAATDEALVRAPVENAVDAKVQAENFVEKAANSNVVQIKGEKTETSELLKFTNAIDNAEMNKETRAERIAKARKQPKSPEEEKKLAERYGFMPLEERAFNILLDLGMVELTPDPDDPSYDDTLDIDNENIIVSDKAVDKQKPAVEKAATDEALVMAPVENAVDAK